jgi:hypothetical protein
MAIAHIDELSRLDARAKVGFESVILFDRGYPSAFNMFYLHNKKNHFLMRCSSSFISQVNEVVESGKTDEIITISAARYDGKKRSKFTQFLPAIKTNSIMKIRVIVFDLPTGEKEILATSLLDRDQFLYDDIIKLYCMRWSIEERYKFYKCIAEIENFSGESTTAIKQDFFATVFTCNAGALLALEAQDELDQKKVEKEKTNPKKPKYDYQINRNVIAGTMKNDILDIFLGDHDMEKKCQDLKERMKLSPVPIRPNRSYPRDRQYGRREKPIDKRCL